jgi:hypothetical protein
MESKFGQGVLIDEDTEDPDSDIFEEDTSSSKKTKSFKKQALDVE